MIRKVSKTDANDIMLQMMSSSFKQKFVGIESKGVSLQSGELLKLQGPAIFLNKISGNGRKYIPESVHAQVNELRPRIMAKALFGELDHPPVDDLMRLAYVKGTEISHRIDDIWWVEEEQCYYIAVTILDTPNGRILKTLFDSGSPLYVSLRSLLDPNRQVSHGSYYDAWMSALITIDFVTRPGFADAIMSPMPIGNESMLAVCESLNIISSLINENGSKRKRNGNVLNKYNKNNSNVNGMKRYAIESIANASDESRASSEFMAKVNSIILKIIDDFKTGFGFDEFNMKYEGQIDGCVVGVYPNTAELMIQSPDEPVNAIVQLMKPEEDTYVLTNTAEVSYVTSNETIEQEIEEMATESMNKFKRGKRMYAIIGTENYSPTPMFTSVINDIFNRLVANFSNGFDESDFNDVLNVISDGNGFTAEINDDYIVVRCPDNDNAAKISLIKDGDMFTIGEISEYFDPNGEDAATESVEAIIKAARFRWNNGGKERYAALEAKAVTGTQASVEAIMEAARFRWNNGGRERYAAFESEMQPNLSGTNIEDNLADAASQQPYQVVEDDDDDVNDNPDDSAMTEKYYQVIEDNSPQQSYTIIDENPDEGEEDGDKEDDDDEDGDGDEDVKDEIATEAARILGMPNSKYAGNYAIEHMPIAYKHLWSGLSDTAKQIIANQAKYVGNESECLKFWQNTNFVAIEQAVIRQGGNLVAGVETDLSSIIKPLEDPRKSFLGTLPSVKGKIW